MLSIQTPEDMAKEALKKMKEGYQSFKIKVGSSNVLDDVKRIKAVSEAVGPDQSSRVDANQS